MKAQHSSSGAEYYTPFEWVDIARQVMGGIDLDPASCSEANQVVRAARYLTQAQDGLSVPWFGRVFLNPPSVCGPVVKGRRPICGNEKNCSCRLVPRFWEHLVTQWAEGYVEQAFWVGFTLNQLQTLQNTPVRGPLWWCGEGGRRCAIHIPAQRINYEGHDGKSPPHPSFFVYLGPADLDLCAARLTLLEALVRRLGETVSTLEALCE